MYGENIFYYLQFSLVAMTHTEKKKLLCPQTKGKGQLQLFRACLFQF